VRPDRFWDAKIGGWDHTRYLRPNPVWWRSRLAAERINAQPACHVVDLGCGGGRLLEQLRGHRLTGVDFSAAALELAARRCPGADFQRLDLSCQPLPEADLYVGLGLLDWLQPDQIGALLGALGDKPFLFSFSEWRLSPWLALHWIYIRLTTRAGQPRPAYHRAGWLQQQVERPTNIWRDRRLHFGAFLCHGL
jgi:SAM-dependent methyltransferase